MTKGAKVYTFCFFLLLYVYEKTDIIEIQGSNIDIIFYIYILYIKYILSKYTLYIYMYITKLLCLNNNQNEVLDIISIIFILQIRKEKNWR